MSETRFCYEHPRASVTTDSVIFKLTSNALEVLLIERKHDPFKNCWALPGGFLEMDENGLECAKRELLEETSLEVEEMDQVGTFSNVLRDPRGRTISIAYTSIVHGNVFLNAGDDAKNVQWFSISNLPDLAFDHPDIINESLRFLQIRISANVLPVSVLKLDNTLIDALKEFLEKALKRKV